MFFIGLDLGGTKIEAAVVDEGGATLYAKRILTQQEAGADAVIHRMFGLIDGVLADANLNIAQIKGIGIGVPGAVNHAAGAIYSLVNLTGWTNFPIRDVLQARYPLPIALDNDANAAALGEFLFGNGTDCQDMLYLTVSTGIGGGIVLNGKLYSGSKGAAGEVGHMVLLPDGEPCNCGNKGCWETISSGTAIAKEAQRRILLGEETILRNHSDANKITAKHVFSAREMGDNLATAVIDRAIHFLGLGTANLVNILNPEKVIIGGGVAEAGDFLISAVEKVVREMAYGPAKAVQILPALLGTKSGVIGAAALAIEDSKKRGTADAPL